LAAAIAGHADAIVTYNLADFPAEALAAHDVEVQHPDAAFIMNQLELHKATALAAIKQMRQGWTRPSRSAEELVRALELRGLPQTATYLAEAAASI
jgi:hypothetical protein